MTVPCLLWAQSATDVPRQEGAPGPGAANRARLPAGPGKTEIRGHVRECPRIGVRTGQATFRRSRYNRAYVAVTSERAMIARIERSTGIWPAGALFAARLIGWPAVVAGLPFAADPARACPPAPFCATPFARSPINAWFTASARPSPP